MKRLLILVLFGLMSSTTAHAAGLVSGVGAITEGFNNNNNVLGGTVLTNTGTILDGLYGTENKGYLVDDYSGGLSWSDNLEFHATLVMNDDGTVNGADNIAILGYFSDNNHGDGNYNPADGADGDRGQSLFGLGLLGPNDGRMFIKIGGNDSQGGTIGNWASSFGRNNPFEVDLFASEAAGVLTVTGTISDGNVTINVNETGNVNSGHGIEAFGTSQGFLQSNTFRNYGMDVSDLSYISPAGVIPEPGSIGLALLGLTTMFARRRAR